MFWKSLIIAGFIINILAIWGHHIYLFVANVVASDYCCVSTNAPDDHLAVRRSSVDWRPDSDVSYVGKRPAENPGAGKNKYGVLEIPKPVL